MSVANNPIMNCNLCEEYWPDSSNPEPQCQRRVCNSCGSCEGGIYTFPGIDFDLCENCFREILSSTATGITKINQTYLLTEELFAEEKIYVIRKAITESEREEIFRRDGYKCVHCGSGENLQIDHIKPFSNGGNTELDNLQTLCRLCNNKKRNRFTG